MKRTWLIGLSIIILAGGTGWGAWKWMSPKPSDEVAVTHVTVENRTITNSITGTGTVTPANRVEIKPPISGRIESILVDEGSKVAKGEIIAWMSSTERAAILDQARSKGPNEVKKWESMYRAAPLIAPISGTIISRPVEPGQTVAQSEILLVVADTLLINVQIDETDIGKVKIGQPVSIDLDAYPDHQFRGWVSQISYEAQMINNVTVYIVKVLPTSPPREMRSGMTAYVSFVANIAKDRPSLPNEAIRTVRGHPTVLVAQKKGPATPVSIKTGITDGRFTEILSGIASGTDVVIKKRQMSRRRGEGGGANNPLSPQMGRPGGRGPR
jgi:macrolide-specific efflux system membrane fusion protein